MQITSSIAAVTWTPPKRTTSVTSAWSTILPFSLSLCYHQTLYVVLSTPTTKYWRCSSRTKWVALRWGTLFLCGNKTSTPEGFYFLQIQIKVADGNWIGADPIPNSILVNTGDLLEVWTNHFYPATLHRSIRKRPTNDRNLVTHLHPTMKRKFRHFNPMSYPTRMLWKRKRSLPMSISWNGWTRRTV